MILRRERSGDASAIAALHASAFVRPEAPDVEPPEVQLVALLRASGAWIPALSIVAVAHGSIVGHVACSRAMIGNKFRVLGLGPLGVAPADQHALVGSALMHAVVAAADALDEPLIGLLGNPAYYERFGFEAAAKHGIPVRRSTGMATTSKYATSRLRPVTSVETSNTRMPSQPFHSRTELPLGALS